MRGLSISLLVASFASLAICAQAGEDLPVKNFFGTVPNAAPAAPKTIGFYTLGCVAGAKALPADGPAWQAMRLSRNRNWGLPVLVNYIETMAQDARTIDGWPGLLVGDMSQPRGGPMISGHASHQTGLDVDIWFDPMPDRTLTRDERETRSATSYIKKGTDTELNRNKWTDSHSAMIKRAASYPEVQRIFVNAGIKKELCRWAGDDRGWLRKVRPWYRHEDHLHVRLRCPKGMTSCKAQNPTAAGDGCGENLTWWLSPARYKKATGPIRYKPELTIADLPAACRPVLAAGPDGIVIPAGAYVPQPRFRPKVN